MFPFWAQELLGATDCSKVLGQIRKKLGPEPWGKRLQFLIISHFQAFGNAPPGFVCKGIVVGVHSWMCCLNI